jgi:tRNA(fMet)-specific endonuclease VapC
MTYLLVDTDVVSIVFRHGDPRKPRCEKYLTDRRLAISFMTLAELFVWPRANNWGAARRASLDEHISRYTIVLPDEETCRVWADINNECDTAGLAISPTDAWIAATAVRWDLELVTGDFRDYAGVSKLKVVPVE